jgi:heptosyltransferase-1
VKTSSLGDVVHHCPAVSDAARHVPGAAIDWMVEEAFAAVPAMHPAVRRVIPVAVRRWRSALWKSSVWSEMATFKRALRGQAYDVVVDSQGLLKSAWASRFASGAVHGLDAKSAREPLAARFYDATHSVPRNLHAVERNRRLTAQALGYRTHDRIDYGLKTDRPLPLAFSAPYAVFLTMTSRADKLWPETEWIALGRALGTRIVLPWGSEAERSRAQRIAEGIGSASVPQRLALDELAAVLAQADAVVGLDTGLTHLAAALGARTIGIYGGSDPRLTGLYGAANAVNVGVKGNPPSVAEVLKVLN